MPNTYTIQEIIQGNFDLYIELEEKDRGVEHQLIFHIPKGKRALRVCSYLQGRQLRIISSLSVKVQYGFTSAFPPNKLEGISVAQSKF